MSDKLRLTVITSDAGMAANVGGHVAHYSRTFDLPPEIADYIASQIGTYSHVTFALERATEAVTAAQGVET